VSLLPFLFVALSLGAPPRGEAEPLPSTTTNPDGSAQKSIIPHMSAKNCYSTWIWFVAPSRHFGVFNRADHTKRPALHHLHQCEANDRGTYVMWATRVSFRSCTHPRVPTWRDMAADSTTPEGTLCLPRSHAELTRGWNKKRFAGYRESINRAWRL
jgi:hypothetical protein